MKVASFEKTNACEGRFDAMGSYVHVIVTGGTRTLLDVARARIAELESSWSRFRPDSEVSRLNDSDGSAFVVSEDLFDAISRAVDGWAVTDGAYDPTILPALERAGYDRTFERVTDDERPASPADAAPGCGEIDLDEIDRTVALPRDVRIDLGGIGKGLAADLVSRELIDAGAAGVLVNVGGDLRVRGASPSGEGWVLSVADPFARRGVTVVVADGAIATSTTIKRHWRRGPERMHHLIDPRTGAPTANDVVSVSVVAREAWWAEVLTKVVFVRGPDVGAERLEALGVHGLFVTCDGRSTVAGDWRDLFA